MGRMYEVLLALVLGLVAVDAVSGQVIIPSNAYLVLIVLMVVLGIAIGTLRLFQWLARPVRSLLFDEQDKLSSARLAFWATLAITLVLVTFDSLTLTVQVPEPAYSLLGTLVVMTAGWAAGPRIMQYVGPQLAGVATGIGKAVRSKREPDLYTDDERG